MKRLLRARAPSGGAELALVAASALASWLVPGPAQGADRPVGYNREVRPILSENCFACHGPDKSKRKAALRLDVREAAIEDGAIVPGQPAASELVKRLTASHPEDLMPPSETRKVLTPEARALLERWIAQGAPYEPHWSYVPIKRLDPPGPGAKRTGSDAIDGFVRAALADKHLAPSSEADRRTLARRLYLDLVGLPPTPEQLRSFLEDRRPGAYAALVDRLLASPHFGERMAAHWLDVARFADTVGYHGDQNHHVFSYRDYVIDSFNRNKPFDVFTREQLAGDLLPHAGVEQRVATGFNRLNMVTREGGAQPKEYLAKYLGDRVRAVGGAWLGATIGCAECHDHKYDPIAQKDFYSLGAFFGDVTEWGVYQDYPYTPNPDLKGWSNEHPFPPEISVRSPYLVTRAARLRRERAALVASTRPSSPEARETFATWLAESRRHLAAHPTAWTPIVPAAGSVATTAPVKIAVDGDGTVVLDGAPSHETIAVKSSGQGRVSALRLELVPHGSHGATLVRGGKGASMTVSLAVRLVRGGVETRLPIHLAQATKALPRWANGDLSLGVEDEWLVPVEPKAGRPWAVYELAAPIELGPSDSLVVKIGGDRLGAFRLATTPFATLAAPDETAVVATTPRFGAGVRAALADERRAAVLFALSAAADAKPRQRLQELRRELLTVGDGRAPTLVTVARAPRTVRLLPRGNWQDESGEIVAPATPHFLPSLPNRSGRRLTRLDLANWLVWKGNPLTARAVMNRLWKQLFGAGLSPVADDLGAQGEIPSHPELLDWLASEFVDSGWNWKHMVRLIVGSATYRQSSAGRRDVAELDPQNRLLARQAARRLEAEVVRDHALAVAGLLDPSIGGPSVHAYQPDGYWDNLEFPRRSYVAERDERQHRRGIYLHWQRTFPHPMLANFDAPSREECTADRPGSNTPQQALTLLNDPTFVEAARVFAERLLSRKGGASTGDRARLARGFEEALGRTPRDQELASLQNLLDAARAHYRQHGDDAEALIAVGIHPRAPALRAPEVAAWTQVTRAMLNLHESITRL